MERSAAKANDGDNSAAHWDGGAGWNDGTPGSFPDTVIEFEAFAPTNPDEE
ncbi:hypothetical protein [Micromonospora sp. NPDC093277]|uniref:hypothetical protein n=1 Tax=Micromonospora sp. NPDC093277 TaxID=3364291 RepID=UPI003817E1F9